MNQANNAIPALVIAGALAQTAMQEVGILPPQPERETYYDHLKAITPNFILSPMPTAQARRLKARARVEANRMRRGISFSRRQWYAATYVSRRGNPLESEP